MFKRILIAALAGIMVMTSLPMTAHATEVDSMEIVQENAETTEEVVVVAGEESPVAVASTDTEVTASGTCGENLTWQLTSDGTLTISGSGDMDDYAGLEEVPWDACIYDVTKVILDGEITSIGDRAFYYCLDLVSIDIPDSVTSIGWFAFAGCSSLTSISIPGSVETIGTGAFSMADALESVYISEGVKTIEWDAFWYCESLKSISIPDSVTTLGFNAFSNCTALETVKLSSNLTSIDDQTFYGCTSLKTMDIPDGVTVIGGSTFAGCTSLEKIKIPDSVEALVEETFKDCTSLVSIKIPKAVTWIGADTFSGCTSLAAIYGYSGSLAETYAAENGHPFVALDDVEEEETINGVVYDEITGKFYFYTNSAVDTTVNGLAYYTAGNQYLYFENGEWNTEFYGFVEYGGGQFLVANGAVASDISGLQLVGDNFYFLAYGQLQNQYTGLALYDNEWFYVAEGVLQIHYNGLQAHDGASFLIAAGRIVGDYTGLYNDPATGNWYYIVYGQVQTQYSGLVEYDGAWFFVSGGQMAHAYVGLIEYDGAYFYINKGCVDTSFCGNHFALDKSWYIENGQAVSPGKNQYEFTDTVKGMQARAGKHDEGYDYGINHRLLNYNIQDFFVGPDEDGRQFDYKGETYYISNSAHRRFFDNLMELNASNTTANMVFLLGWEEKFGLIDEASRQAGHLYYAPNTENGYLEALFAYLSYTAQLKGLHVDNYILGNEVNMPNQWHYSGSTDVNVVATKYAKAFYQMYTAVRQYSDDARCSISLDHSWQHNDEGRGITAKAFLDVFAATLETYEEGIDWCVSMHLYPAILTEPQIWHTSYLNQRNDGALFVDGNNLFVATNYIKNTYGEQHRVMLTEQGFVNNKGDAYQAAALVYSYYAAKFDPMVDSFIINVEDSNAALNFAINGRTAGEAYLKLDTGLTEDREWIDANILPIIANEIGISGWADIVPNYSEE